MIDVSTSNPFRSFWMGGFECADQLNAFRERVDLVKLTGHDVRLEEDYRNLKELGIATVREGIRWSVTEREPFQYNWSWVENVLHTSKKLGVQVVWDICHFGFPEGLTPFNPNFPERFAAVCKAFVQKVKSILPEEPLVVTPINEVSFLSWLGGEVCGAAPFASGMGWELKYEMMKAYILGIESMKDVDPEIRIMVTEPLVHICAGDTEDEHSVFMASQRHNEQFQVTDMLCGAVCPELGGKPSYLDIIGVNFYFNNQSVLHTRETIPWGDQPPHPSWRTLNSLISEVYERYRKPVVLSETSHPGEHRPQWLQMISDECVSILNNGIPLWGCCIYPVIDRPDWDHTHIWHKSGLWDINDTDTLERTLHPEYAEVFLRNYMGLQNR